MAIPNTLNSMSAFDCMSGMQKSIRRSDEEEAMLFACELYHSSKAFCTMVLNRLQVISHEDIDCIESPWIVPFVETSCRQIKEKYAAGKIEDGRLFLANIILMLCDAPKSRIADHFHTALGYGNKDGTLVPKMEDYMLDHHTAAGRRLGRGLNHFREHASKLIDKCGLDVEEDRWADAAYEAWGKIKGTDA